MKALSPSAALLALALALFSGCGPETDRQESALTPAPAVESAIESAGASTLFTDATAESGVSFVHRSRQPDRYDMPAIMGGGVGVFDADGDGRLDLYFVQSGTDLAGGGPSSANRLFVQQPDRSFVDRTEASGLGDRGYGMGCAVGDIDNDGDLDVFVTNYGADALYRNDGGRFVDITRQAGVAGSGWSASAAFFDADRDGVLDLWVTRYVDFDPARECRIEGGRLDFCGPAQFPGTHDLFYRGLGEGRFEDRSAPAGLPAAEHRGLGLVVADLTDDGWLDVYVANDTDPNNLWVNQGDGTFVDDALLLGLAFNRYGVGEAGMGVVTSDPDDDGDLDLFVSHLIEETNTFYQNQSGLGFEDATAESGLSVPSLSYTGFGTAFFDYDNDGDLDLAIANGAVKVRPAALDPAAGPWASYVEPDQLLELRDGQWVDVSGAGPFGGTLAVSRALVPFDLDGDGDLDLVVTAIEGPARILRNDGPQAGPSGGSVFVSLIDRQRDRFAIGAQVTAVVSVRRLLRLVSPSAGYLSAYVGPLHFGLGASPSVDRFEVRWPDGSRETFPGVEAGGSVELERGAGSDG